MMAQGLLLPWKRSSCCILLGFIRAVASSPSSNLMYVLVNPSLTASARGTLSLFSRPPSAQGPRSHVQSLLRHDNQAGAALQELWGNPPCLCRSSPRARASLGLSATSRPGLGSSVTLNHDDLAVVRLDQRAAYTGVRGMFR